MLWKPRLLWVISATFSGYFIFDLYGVVIIDGLVALLFCFVVWEYCDDGGVGDGDGDGDEKLRVL
jgi:hypothetical protein